MMNVTEIPMLVSMEPPYDTEYQKLLNEYFTSAERNSRASSIQDKKQMMAIKERMALLCNRNPLKLQMLKTIIKETRDAKEKAVVITKSNAVASMLFEELSMDEQTKGVLHIGSQLTVHEVNELKERFNKSQEATAFIITDTVNTGLDLTAAKRLVHYDYPGRYADILQRNNRITRQTSYHKDAAVYYLMTSGKIDEFEHRECMSEKDTLERRRSNI